MCGLGHGQTSCSYLYQPRFIRRSLWTLKRGPDVWSVTVKTYQMQLEAIMSIKLNNKKSLQKSNKQTKNTPHFCQLNSSDILKENIFNFFLHYDSMPRFSALLIFTLFMKISSLVSPCLRTISQSQVLWRPQRDLPTACVKMHLWGKTWQYSDQTRTMTVISVHPQA